MNARKGFPLDVDVIVILLITSISALWLAPAASAQTVIVTGTMDSGYPVSPGDTIAVGYEVSVADASPSPTATTISVTDTVGQVTVSCPNRSSQTITINLTPQSYLVPANVSQWTSSASVYLGQTIMPSSLCGGKQGKESSATFTATYGFTCQQNSADYGCCHNVCFSFHHQHHNGGTPYVGAFSGKSCTPVKQCVTPCNKGPCCSTE